MLVTLELSLTGVNKRTKCFSIPRISVRMIFSAKLCQFVPIPGERASPQGRLQRIGPLVMGQENQGKPKTKQQDAQTLYPELGAEWAKRARKIVLGGDS